MQPVSCFGDTPQFYAASVMLRGKRGQRGKRGKRGKGGEAPEGVLSQGVLSQECPQAPGELQNFNKKQSKDTTEFEECLDLFWEHFGIYFRGKSNSKTCPKISLKMRSTLLSYPIPRADLEAQGVPVSPNRKRAGRAPGSEFPRPREFPISWSRFDRFRSPGLPES